MPQSSLFNNLVTFLQETCQQPHNPTPKEKAPPPPSWVVQYSESRDPRLTVE